MSLPGPDRLTGHDAFTSEPYAAPAARSGHTAGDMTLLDQVAGAHLAILPGLTHYNVFESPALIAAVDPFLDAR